MSELVAAFHGPVRCTAAGGAPFLTLTGTTSGGEPLALTFGAPVPADLPQTLDSPCVERAEGGLCIRAGARLWPIRTSSVHLHYEVPAFYQAIPPREPPWHRRLFFWLLPTVVAHPLGRALLRRLRGG
jgi:hypothetical protein